MWFLYLIALVVLVVIVKKVVEKIHSMCYTTVYARFIGINKRKRFYSGMGTSVTLNRNSSGGYTGSIYRDSGSSDTVYSACFSYKNEGYSPYPLGSDPWYKDDSFTARTLEYALFSDISFDCEWDSGIWKIGDIGILRYRNDLERFSFLKLNNREEAEELLQKQINKIKEKQEVKNTFAQNTETFVERIIKYLLIFICAILIAFVVIRFGFWFYTKFFL